MSNLGIGVMLNMLSSNEDTVKAYRESLGKTIKTISLDGDAAVLRFTDGSGIRIYDDGQSCCERRFMVCDDDLDALSDSELLDIKLEEAPDVPNEYGDPHEVQFLRIHTSKGVAVFSSHNEHNGYYGGFSIKIGEFHE